MHNGDRAAVIHHLSEAIIHGQSTLDSISIWLPVSSRSMLGPAEINLRHDLEDFKREDAREPREDKDLW